MKAFTAGVCGFIFGAIAAVVLVSLVGFANTMESWGEPVVRSDRNLRIPIHELGVDVPVEATDVYLFEVGWQDHSSYIGMTLPTAAAWSAVSAITGFETTEFAEALPTDDCSPADYGEQYQTDAWHIDPSAPLRSAARVTESSSAGRTAIFSPTTGRLLIHDWSY